MKLFKWTSAVMIGLSMSLVCTVSLINFHQYHLFHQPLLQQIVAIKPCSDKSSKALLHNKLQFSIAILPDPLFTSDQIVQLFTIPMAGTDISPVPLLFTPLRAPPLA